MSLSDLASLSTAISGFAVTASLIYLAIQTHQNTRNTRALIHQGAAERTNSIYIGLMNSDYVAAWLEGNGIAATPEAIRHRQFLFHCATAMNAMEDHFLQHKAGLLDTEQFHRNREMFRGLLREPGMRAFWLERRPNIARIAPHYCRYVDSLCDDEVAGFTNAV